MDSIPRRAPDVFSYIQSLLKTLSRLKEQKATKSASQVISESVPAPDFPEAAPLSDVLSTGMQTNHSTPSLAERDSAQEPHRVCHGTHYPVNTPQGLDLRYFGASSVFTLTVATAARVSGDSAYGLKTPRRASAIDMEHSDFHGSCNCIVTKDMVEKSLDLFMASIHPLYPFLDALAIRSDLEAYWETESTAADPETLEGRTAHRYFRIKIIAAIASASRSRHDASRIACDHGCYLEAGE
jgi:hypothetical protein